MGKRIGVDLLYQIQCLYQQKLITNNMKNVMANKVKEAIKNNDYGEYIEFLKSMDIENDRIANLINESITIIERGE